MKALKIAGIVAVIAWMGYITWRLEYVAEVAEATCGIAMAAKLNAATHNFKNDSRCPFTLMLQYRDEVKPKP